MEVNKELCKEIVQYINFSNDYTFKKFADELGLKSDDRGNGDVFYECPFHEDISPSLSANDEKHIFQCFSCGRKGNYLKLLLLYDLDILGIHTNFYHKIDSILKNDPIMQAHFNTNTIFIEGIRVLDIRKDRKRIRFDSEFTPSNHLELADFIIKNKMGYDKIKLMILLMQSGLTPIECLNEITEKRSKCDIDMNNILGGV